MAERFDIFLPCPPGLEPLLGEEAAALGLEAVTVQAGGVACRGGWTDVWRANLSLRGASRVLVRLAEFRAFHLAQLDKRARKLDWAAWLPRKCAVRVETTCRASKIYHDRAATQRIERALADAIGATAEPEAALRLMVRIEDDLVTVSLDTSGELLHKRGFKTFVGKAPIRETMAALFLAQMGYRGDEPLVDPMCGSGTFVLEAAGIAAGLLPGRSRGFAFEALPSFDAAAFAAMRDAPPVPVSAARAWGFDRDDGAIRGAAANADAAGLSDRAIFARAPISDLEPPATGPGLVMVNPPYGARIGNRKLLFGLYGTLGTVLRDRFKGWRVGLVTSDGGLAKATGLPFEPPGPPVPHGGLSVKLYRTGMLG